jgi:serine/threonine-protein kinase
MKDDFIRESAGSAESPAVDSWEKGLKLAFSKRSDPAVSATWKMPDASATPLPDPGPVPAVKPVSEGTLMAEPYKVVGEVGRGGIGVVLQARDLTLGREVAVKILQPRHAANPAAVARFTREAKIAAQLQHPGIVPVYAAGQDELDRPYIAMKLLKGSSLDELLTQRKELSERRPYFIRIFEQVCQTMAYSHSRGVIHRDLKPGNVMVGAFGEVQIIDWGFARVLATPPAEEKRDLELIDAALSPEDSSQLSIAGAPIGTPAYMAPEQALGDLKALDERTDVFCLGSILCEILTGEPTHASSSVREVMEHAKKGDVVAARYRLDRSGAEPELIALAKDCLQPDKTRRPKDAAAVAERVSAHLQASEERVRKAEVRAVEERARAAAERRKKWAVAGLAAALLIVGAGTGWAMWSKAQRHQQLNHEVGVILKEAADYAAGEKWTLALERTLRAQAVLKGSDLSTELRERTSRLIEEYRAQEADRATLDKLYELRSHPGTPPHEMDKRYADAFRLIAIDIDATPAAEIGRLVRTRGVDARELLILALDDWYMRFKPELFRQQPPAPRRPDDPPDRRGPPDRPERDGPEEDQQDPQRRFRILEAGIASDDHPWRNRLRRAILDQDNRTLDELSASIPTEKPPVMSLILLSHAVSRGEEINDAALKVLLQAYMIHPADFWISFFIGNGVVARKSDPRMMELATRHARLTVSLNPRAPHAYGLLAGALFSRGRPDDREEALAMLRKSIDLDGGTRYGETAGLILKAHETGDRAVKDEIRRRSEGRRHPPMMQALFDSVPR